MNEDQKRWQADGKKAFDWIGDLYTQTLTANNDARALFEEDHWTVKFRDRWGGDAYTTILDQWPFLYLTAFCALPEEKDGTEEVGTAAMFGFIFYDSKRAGPHCFAGRIRWSSADAKPDHWMLYSALGGPAVSPMTRHQDKFVRTGTSVQTAKPTAKGIEWRPGVEEVSWFEVPLGTITSPERLREIVSAAQALVAGDDTQAKKVVETI